MVNFQTAGSSPDTPPILTRKRDRFAGRVFLVAGIYGVVVLLPQYFMEGLIGKNDPPPITHPEHFYGFIGVSLTWQLVFFVISMDVRKYRLLMLPAILEKLSFGLAAAVLYINGRAAVSVLAAGALDLILAVFFILAFRATGGEASTSG